jgi:hypothetical protein
MASLNSGNAKGLMLRRAFMVLILMFSLAGVPLRILLSDRSGPGALLRDTLMIRPSTRDP